MRPIAIVQHEPSVPPGLIAGVLEEAGADHFVVEAWREQKWPTVDELGGVVVLGGTMNVDELDAHPFLRNSRTLMRAAVEGGLPTLGVCLGAQMMARVLGGGVVRAGTRNALFSELKIVNEDPLIAPFSSGVSVLQFHEDTFTLPPDVVELATSAASGLYQAFRYGERAYAIQFHFEVDEGITRGWCDDIGDERLRSEWGTSTDDLLAEAAAHLDGQERAGRALVTEFLRLAS